MFRISGYRRIWLVGSLLMRNWIAAFGLFTWIFLAALLAQPIARAQAAESPALERVNFGFRAAGSVATAPLWMAQDSGIELHVHGVAVAAHVTPPI